MNGISSLISFSAGSLLVCKKKKKKKMTGFHMLIVWAVPFQKAHIQSKRCFVVVVLGVCGVCLVKFWCLLRS